MDSASFDSQKDKEKEQAQCAQSLKKIFLREDIHLLIQLCFIHHYRMHFHDRLSNRDCDQLQKCVNSLTENMNLFPMIIILR
jgi:hypothetical protein